MTETPQPNTEPEQHKHQTVFIFSGLEALQLESKLPTLLKVSDNLELPLTFNQLVEVSADHPEIIPSLLFKMALQLDKLDFDDYDQFSFYDRILATQDPALRDYYFQLYSIEKTDDDHQLRRAALAHLEAFKAFKDAEIDPQLSMVETYLLQRQEDLAQLIKNEPWQHPTRTSKETVRGALEALRLKLTFLRQNLPDDQVIDKKIEEYEAELKAS